MSLTHYRFTSVWTIAGPPGEAYEVLKDVTSYPGWWPEVKHVSRVAGGDSYELRCRSLLPYDLTFVILRSTEDEAAGVLEASMRGDLEGFSRWTVTGTQSLTRLVFDEEVITNKSMLNRLAPLARPAFKANHSLMMRHGENGLRTYLAGFRHGRMGESRSG